MAHNLYIQDGRASMMYFGEKPWHGLGQEVDHPATAAQALAAAMLDYDVIKQPVYASVGSGKQEIPRKYALVRADQVNRDDCPVYGVVGANYTPLQNREAFQFFDPIVGEGAAIYHTAGALGNGEHVWILAKLPGHIRVVGDDVAEKYLLLSNSHDGQSSVRVKFTPVRVVCQNTLTMALKRGSAVRVPHTKNVVDNLRNAHEMLGIINNGFEQFQTLYRRMADVQVNANMLDRYLRTVFPDPNGSDSGKARKIAAQHRAWATHFFAEGRGNQEKGVKGTLWAAYNGVTEYVDHHKGKKSDEQHLYSVWFGSGYQIKSRAFESAVESLPRSTSA